MLRNPPPHLPLSGILTASLLGLFILFSAAPPAHAQVDAAPGSALLSYDIAEAGLDGRAWYVSPEGDDAGPGTADAPLATLQAAADRVQPGQSILLLDGTHTEGGDDVALMALTTSGTPDAWIRIAPAPDAAPEIRFDRLRALVLKGVSHVLVEGLHIVGVAPELDRREARAFAEAFDGTDYTETKWFGVGIRLDPDDPPAEPDAAAEVAGFPHHIILRDNVIHDCPGSGIATARADYLLIQGNTVYRNGFYSPWGESGISVWESGNVDDRTDVYRTVIRDNVCFANDNRVIFWIMKKETDGNGIILDALKTNQGIAAGTYAEPYSGRILVANNRCWFNGGRGVNIFEADHADVVHNTLYRNAQRGNVDNEIELGRAEHNRIFNNLIVVEPGKQAIGGYSSPNNAIDFNGIAGSTAGSFPYGENSLEDRPRFMKPPNRGTARRGDAWRAVDLRLRPNSPGLGAGAAAYALPEDAAGKPRDVAAPNLGALAGSGS